MNFSLHEKKRIKIIMLVITILGQASIALYLPALPSIAKDLNITDFQSKLTITYFIIGFGISPLFMGPISDYWGRKPILLFSLITALIGFLGNSFCSSFYMFVIFRVIEGIGCGGLLTSGRSIARDVFSGKELASASSYLSMGFALGFGFSPVVGGFLAEHFIWQSAFIFLFIFCFSIICICILFLPETKQFKEHDDSHHIMKSILQSYITAVLNKLFIINILAGFFAYCIVISYNTLTPFLVQINLGFSAENYGYLAILIGVPYFLAASINRKLVLEKGIYFSCLIGGTTIILSGFIMFIFSLFGYRNIYTLIIPFMGATFGQAFIFSNTIAAAMQLFPANVAGRISALYSSLQMILVSVFSLFIAKTPDRIDYVACIIICVGFLSFVAVIFSEKARKYVIEVKVKAD